MELAKRTTIVNRMALRTAILILDFAMEKFPDFARKQGQF
jgi:hypothetical protein